MKVLNIIGSFILAILLAGNVSAQVDIISAKDFMALTKSNDKLVIIDANKAKNYDVNHIKGAINIEHGDLYRPGDIEGLIKSPEDLAAFFGSKGINENSEVVIYDDGSQKYNTRIYWILKYIGAKNVRILHKDMDAWRAVRVPLTSTPGKFAATDFTPTVNPAIFATLDDVKARMGQPGVVLIDCRTPDEYNGVSKSEGHLPGAININHEDLLTETGAFKTAEELKAIAEKNGITASTEILMYCRTSVRACVEFVVFKNILGYENVRVYDGAYLEWVASNPVVQ
jgi:thiosulfate/3-mercaptopyruvate sulfurtransferase